MGVPAGFFEELFKLSEDSDLGMWAVDNSVPPNILSQRLLQAVSKAENQVSNPFEVGDLVTPLAGCGLKGRGVPQYVVSVFPLSYIQFGKAYNVRPVNMTVAVYDPGEDQLLYFMALASNFEEWKETVAYGD
jgi:hypothetical protein